MILGFWVFKTCGKIEDEGARGFHRVETPLANFQLACGCSGIFIEVPIAAEPRFFLIPHGQGGLGDPTKKGVLIS